MILITLHGTLQYLPSVCLSQSDSYNHLGTLDNITINAEMHLVSVLLKSMRWKIFYSIANKSEIECNADRITYLCIVDKYLSRLI